jgi:tripartite-type tricarboxylate transporter receptor subunit TctC
VPTLRESGLADYVSGSWQGVLTPTGTRPEIIQRLHGAIVEAMRRSDVRQKLQAGGVAPDVSESPTAFARFIGREAERRGSLATRARIAVD